MLRDTDIRLLKFCAYQQRAFNPAAWLTVEGATHDEVAAAALFLSERAWYGHREALRRVADKLRPGCGSRIIEQFRSAGFDCSRFDGLLRAEVSHESRVA